MPYALITGASKGIGKNIAMELAMKGYNILLIARSEKLLQDLAKELENKYKILASYLALDLTTENASKYLFNYCIEKKYDIEILVNNAGYGLSGPFEKYTVEDYNNLMKINMNVPIELCKLFLPQLKLLKKAYILNIASTTAYQAIPGFAIYAASKSFILSFSRALTQELKNTNVVVTCVSPGSTDTDFVIRSEINNKALKMAKKVNMTPESVARIAVQSIFNKKIEVVPGLLNKISCFLVWLLPKSLIEISAKKIYTS